MNTANSGECILALMSQGRLFFDSCTTLINTFFKEEEEKARVKGDPEPSAVIALVGRLCQRPTLVCDWD